MQGRLTLSVPRRAPAPVIVAPPPWRTRPDTPHLVEPDLFLLATAIDCATWNVMAVETQRNVIAGYYHIDSTSPIVTLALSKYRGDCTWRPGRALAAMGLDCARWQSMTHVDRTLRLVTHASPDRTPKMGAFSDYADAITAYCGSVSPSGQVTEPTLQTPITDSNRFWQATTVVALGLAYVMWRRSQRK